MKKTLIAAVAAAFLLASGTAIPTPAYAKNDKNQAELKDCKKIADPKAKDECVKQNDKAKNQAKPDKDDKGKGKGK